MMFSRRFGSAKLLCFLKLIDPYLLSANEALRPHYCSMQAALQPCCKLSSFHEVSVHPCQNRLSRCQDPGMPTWSLHVKQ